MKALLMFEDRDFSSMRKPPWNGKALIQDLGLETLCNAMAGEDEFMLKVMMDALLSSVNVNERTVIYRQEILKDFQNNTDILMNLYKIIDDAIEVRKKSWSFFSKYPSSILYSGVSSLKTLLVTLRQLRTLADEHSAAFKSRGFIRFFDMIRKELTDEYLIILEGHLKELEFKGGTLLSAQLGKANKGIRYILHRLPDIKASWVRRLFTRKPPWYTFSIHPRDEGGTRALSELRSEGINSVANALAQSTDHVLDFLNTVKEETVFYFGCLNLEAQLKSTGSHYCYPVPLVPEKHKTSFKGLYDISLSLTLKQEVVSNDLEADAKSFVVITGANQGGKTTFLRSIGLAQLMMQSGMFVPAKSFSADVCDSLCTHYKRKEDENMKSGKLDEELSRMSEIVDNLTTHPLILFNESFAATNEREGSEISRQIVTALLENGVKIFFVTHLFEFAHSFFSKGMKEAVFLRAERESDGTRTFRVKDGEPLQTSYGEDIYTKIFGTEAIEK